MAKITPHPNTMINSKEDLYKYFDNGIEKDKYILYTNKDTPFEKLHMVYDTEIEALKASRKHTKANPSIIHADVKFLYHNTLRVVCEVYELD